MGEEVLERIPEAKIQEVLKSFQKFELIFEGTFDRTLLDFLEDSLKIIPD